MNRQTGMRCRRRHLSGAVAMALASLASAMPVHAQQVEQTTQDDGSTGAVSVSTVRVVGARQAQESAIGRKKKGDTAQDSIVAEDVGAFPDRNVADAISRIAGVAVDRGDYGEGISVSIRGNGPELTRVELDGQGVQSAGGADLLGGMNAGSDQSGGRAVEMRQLSSDLIKSVDVIKGSTADMTEGSLGGSVRITTRNGLDFKKDYLSLRVAGMENTLNKKLNPNLNLVGVKKLMDDRLGVLVNLSKSKVAHESHSINQGGSSSAVGAYRPLDFDNSPEKTFSFQPNTVKLDDPISTTPLMTSNLIGGGTFNAATPQEIVSKSAAAQTKAACYQAFPLLTTAQSNALVAGNNRTNAINQRQLELLSCLGQWNDYVPSSTRYFVNRQNEDRNSGDIRFDFKVSDELSVYVKHSRSSRDVISETSSAGYGGPAFNPTSVTGPNRYIGPSWTDTVAPIQLPNGASATRNVVPASGYFLYPDLSWRTGGAANGSTSNIDPNSVAVDANHHLTRYTIADGSFGVENTMLDIKEKSRYTQAGGTYKSRYIFAELLLGDARSDFSRFERRAGMSGYTGPVQATLLPNGIWNYQPSASFDPNNPDNYFALRSQAALAAFAGSAYAPATPAYTSGQLPLIDPSRTLSLQNARINEQTERTAKLDVAFNTSDFTNGYLPRFKVGYNRRKSDYSAWGTGGMTVEEPIGTWGTPGYIPGIFVPNKNLRTTYQICENTPGSLSAGGRPCNYGYTPNPDPRANLGGAIQITADQFRDIFAKAYSKQPTSQFYNGDPDRPAGLISGWTEIDIDKLYKLLEVPNYNLDCVKSCAGSDGQMYAQPMNKLVETVDAGYLMLDFSLDRVPFSERSLPLGIAFDGNIGVRVVRTKVVGTGQLALQSSVKNANFNHLDPANANGVTTAVYRRDTEISDVATDYLPSVNLNTWLMPNELVLRYNWAKTIARPPGGRLIPSGTCYFDERFTDELDADGEPRAQYCSGTMGNPSLEPMTNRNQNLSLEWYPNKDYMLAGAVYRQEGIIGAPTLVEAVNAAALFAGSTQVDSQTGKVLGEEQFDYRRWINQLPHTRTGYELSGKAAFTFLPWYLRYLGVDANYTRNKSKLTGTAVLDLLTGTVMPVAGEPHHSWNASLWYDDGALSARVAVQFVAEKFSCISGCNSTAVNNYPAHGLTTVRAPVYAPGAPNFRLGTRYIDAKIGYRLNKNIELFVEGRNLGKIHTGATTGSFAQFADGTPNVYTDTYAGATYMAGVNFRFE